MKMKMMMDNDDGNDDGKRWKIRMDKVVGYKMALALWTRVLWTLSFWAAKSLELACKYLSRVLSMGSQHALWVQFFFNARKK